MLDAIAAESRYSAKHIIPFDLTLVKGEGVYVFDRKGRRYLDMVSGISVANFGHGHPKLLKALQTQAKKIAATSRLFHNEPLGLLLQKACQLTSMDKAIPMNTGAEAVETAIKVIRKWGYVKKQIPSDKAQIIVCDDNFHGRTVSTVSMSSIEQYKAHFGPLTPGFLSVPYGDIDALSKAITSETAGFIIEPIQGEAGIVEPPAGYLKACEQLCREKNILLACDEIQTGMGRTGKFLAIEHAQISPDLILLGKALGGGLLPVSLVLGREPVMAVLTQGDHGSTFGGNPLASNVAVEALNTLFNEQLIEKARILGKYFKTQLEQIDSPLIKGVRGKGLLIGLEMNTQKIASNVFSRCLIDNGLLNINTRGYLIRLLPPLTITQAQIDEGLEMIKTTLTKCTERAC